MFTTFCATDTTSVALVSCMPMNHPVSPYRHSMAGAPHTHIL